MQDIFIMKEGVLKKGFSKGMRNKSLKTEPFQNMDILNRT